MPSFLFLRPFFAVKPLTRLAQISIIGCTAFGQQPQGQALVQAAQKQIGVTLHYDPSYQRLTYPGGDLPKDRGVCTDVIIRAYRHLGIDLQKQVHEDMRKAWHQYPKIWGLKSPDRNIDHRRVPNLQTFFKRHGQSFPIPKDAQNILPGDLVTWRLPGGLPHIGIVSTARSPQGWPMIIHNIGEGTREEDRLFAWTITGHYRY